MVVFPEYRHTGLATRVIGALIEKCRQLGVSTIDWNALPMGCGEDERLGFKVMRDVAIEVMS
ncbi:MAG: GNAT family N-acetyltransferase [Butyricimonas virosa]